MQAAPGTPPPPGRPQETLAHRPKTSLPCLQRDGQQGEPTEGTEAGGRPEHCGSTGDRGRGAFLGGLQPPRWRSGEDTGHGTKKTLDTEQREKLQVGPSTFWKSVRGMPRALVWAPP